jgi:hypothetical protein
VDQLRKSRANITTQAINEVREQIKRGQVELTSTPVVFPLPEENKIERVIDREEDKKRVEKLNQLSVSIHLANIPSI